MQDGKPAAAGAAAADKPAQQRRSSDGGAKAAAAAKRKQQIDESDDDSEEDKPIAARKAPAAKKPAAAAAAAKKPPANGNAAAAKADKPAAAAAAKKPAAAAAKKPAAAAAAAAGDGKAPRVKKEFDLPGQTRETPDEVRQRQGCLFGDAQAHCLPRCWCTPTRAHGKRQGWKTHSLGEGCSAAQQSSRPRGCRGLGASLQCSSCPWGRGTECYSQPVAVLLTVLVCLFGVAAGCRRTRCASSTPHCWLRSLTAPWPSSGEPGWRQPGQAAGSTAVGLALGMSACGQFRVVLDSTPRLGSASIGGPCWACRADCVCVCSLACHRCVMYGLLPEDEAAAWVKANKGGRGAASTPVKAAAKRPACKLLHQGILLVASSAFRLGGRGLARLDIGRPHVLMRQ